MIWLCAALTGNAAMYAHTLKPGDSLLVPSLVHLLSRAPSRHSLFHTRRLESRYFWASEWPRRRWPW